MNRLEQRLALESRMFDAMLDYLQDGDSDLAGAHAAVVTLVIKMTCSLADMMHKSDAEALHMHMTAVAAGMDLLRRMQQEQPQPSLH